MSFFFSFSFFLSGSKSIQEHVLHLIVLSCQGSSVWNSCSVFCRLSCLWPSERGFQPLILRMTPVRRCFLVAGRRTRTLGRRFLVAFHQRQAVPVCASSGAADPHHLVKLVSPRPLCHIVTTSPFICVSSLWGGVPIYNTSKPFLRKMLK